jgi:hypothetical protein
MKPKMRYAIIGSAVLILIALIALFARGKDELLRYIPDDAALVVRIDPKRMLDGIDIKKITGSDKYRALESSAYNESALLSKLVAKAGRHPEKTGIRWDKPVYIFVRKEKGKEYSCILFHVKNSKTLKDWVEGELPRNASVKSQGELNLVARPYGQSWGWNNEALILLDVSSRHGSDLLEDHLNRTYDDYILNKKEFNQAMQRDAGITVYADMPTLYRTIEKLSLDNMVQNYARNNMAVWLDFHQGEVQISTRMLGEENKAYREIINPASIPEEIVGTGDGNSPLLHFAMNLKWKDLFDLMEEEKGKSRHNSDMKSIVQALSEMKGGMCLQLAKSKIQNAEQVDEQPYELEDEDDYNPFYYRKPTMPVGMTVRLQLQDHAKTIDSLLQERSILSGLSDIGPFSTYSTHRPPGMLRLLFDQEEKGKMKFWDDKRLPSGFLKKPVQFFIDLDPDANPFLSESNEFLRESVRKKFAMHMNQFSHFYYWSDAKSSDCKLVFKDKNKGSMEILLNMIMDINSIDADI